METKEKKQIKPRKKKEDKKLSKVGKWLRSNEAPIIVSYDLRAVLK